MIGKTNALMSSDIGIEFPPVDKPASISSLSSGANFRVTTLRVTKDDTNISKINIICGSNIDNFNFSAYFKGYSFYSLTSITQYYTLSSDDVKNIFSLFDFSSLPDGRYILSFSAFDSTASNIYIPLSSEYTDVIIKNGEGKSWYTLQNYMSAYGTNIDKIALTTLIRIS